MFRRFSGLLGLSIDFKNSDLELNFKIKLRLDIMRTDIRLTIPSPYAKCYKI